MERANGNPLAPLRMVATLKVKALEPSRFQCKFWRPREDFQDVSEFLKECTPIPK